MTDIPEWAMAKAGDIASQIYCAIDLDGSAYIPYADHPIIARVLAEVRSEAYEECAKIADGYADAMAMAGENGEMLPIAPFIAQAIRSKANQ